MEKILDYAPQYYGEVFGMEVRNYKVGLYIEDDGYWHLGCVFHEDWLDDLSMVTARAIVKRDQAKYEEQES